MPWCWAGLYVLLVFLLKLTCNSVSISSNLRLVVVAIFKSYQQLTKYHPAQLKSQGGKQENCQSRTAYEKLQSRELYEKLSIKFGAGYSGERVILIETLLALRVILERGLFSRAGCLGARTVYSNDYKIANFHLIFKTKKSISTN